MENRRLGRLRISQKLSDARLRSVIWVSYEGCMAVWRGTLCYSPIASLAILQRKRVTAQRFNICTRLSGRIARIPAALQSLALNRNIGGVWPTEEKRHWRSTRIPAFRILVDWSMAWLMDWFDCAQKYRKNFNALTHALYRVKSF